MKLIDLYDHLEAGGRVRKSTWSKWMFMFVNPDDDFFYCYDRETGFTSMKFTPTVKAAMIDTDWEKFEVEPKLGPIWDVW